MAICSCGRQSSLCFMRKPAKFNWELFYICKTDYYFQHGCKQIPFHLCCIFLVYLSYLKLAGNWFMLNCLFNPFTGGLWEASRSLYMLAWSKRNIWFSRVCWCWIQTRFQGVFPCWCLLNSRCKFWSDILMSRIVHASQLLRFMLRRDMEMAYILG